MEFTCPSCWSKHTIQPGMLSLVCQYCNSVSIVERDILVETWQKSLILPFPTVFSVGKNFYVILNNSSNDKFLKKKVEYISEEEFYHKKLKDYFAKVYVYGQIRYVNDGGFWDDWFVRILDCKEKTDSNKSYILKEDEWLIYLQYIKSIDNNNQNTEVLNAEAWSSYEWLFVQESWTCKIEWFSWSFPFLLQWQQESKYVNLIWKDQILEVKQIWEYILLLINF